MLTGSQLNSENNYIQDSLLPMRESYSSYALTN